MIPESTPAALAAVHVTEHAVDRWCERVENAPRDRVRATIEAAAPAIAFAAEHGARVVKMGCGARLILEGARVVTVLGRGQFAGPRHVADRITP